MAQQPLDPADDNARNRWQPDENVQGPQPDPGDLKGSSDRPGGGAEGRDNPPADRRDHSSPWLGGG